MKGFIVKKNIFFYNLNVYHQNHVYVHFINPYNRKRI